MHHSMTERFDRARRLGPAISAVSQPNWSSRPVTIVLAAGIVARNDMVGFPPLNCGLNGQVSSPT